VPLRAMLRAAKFAQRFNAPGFLLQCLSPA
jgi:hypothetical protein